MSWEGFWIVLAALIGVPLLLAAFVIVAIASVICAVPVGMSWALAAMVRPQILRGALPSWPPPGTEAEPRPAEEPK